MSTASDWYRIAKNLLRFKWSDETNYDADRVLPTAMWLHGADLISSEVRTEFGADIYHKVLIDLDVPAMLVPSSTEGHSHLYIDVQAPWPKIEALLQALVDIGAVEQGYMNASVERKGTRLRVPWLNKAYREQSLRQQTFHQDVKDLEQQ
jgi:hypothetical protein